MTNLKWGSEIEKERWKRIHVCLYAYAYEVKSNPIVSDADFDKLCQSIDLTLDTDHPVMDAWFKKHFQPHTGQWIWCHPEWKKLEAYYENITAPAVPMLDLPPWV